MAAKRPTKKTAKPADAKPIAPQPSTKEEPAKTTPLGWPVDFAELTQGLLLEELAPAALLVNSQCEIVHVYGPTARYLEAPTGKPTHDVRLMIPRTLRSQLNGAIAKALSQEQPIELDNLHVKCNGVYRPIRVSIKPMHSPQGAEKLLLIVFREARESLPPPQPPVGANAEELQKHLRATQKHLEETIAALQGSNENLTVSNEELMSLNEELQVANEEIETAKEEEQSLNEELLTVNTRLEEKAADLAAANDDVVNLLNCSDIAVIFLDRDLRIRRFTPSASQVANLIESDVGRPFGQLTLKIPDDELLTDCRCVLSELTVREKEIVAGDRWWLRRIMPFRTLSHRIDGIVITFDDVTHIKQADQKARLLATVLMDSTDAIIVHDFQGRISTWNRGAERLYGYSEAEAIEMNVDCLIPEPSRAEMHSVWKRIEQGEHLQSWEAQRVTRDGRTVNIWITLTALTDKTGRPAAIAKIDRDITDRVRARALLEQEVSHRTAELAEQRERLRAIVDGANDAIITIDVAGKMESVNTAAERLFGYPATEMIGQDVKMLMPAPYCDEHEGYLTRYLQTREKHVIGIGREVEARHKDGTIFPVEIVVGEIEHLKLFTGTIRDITVRKRLEREVVEIALLEQQRIGQDLHDECGQQLTALGLLADSLVESLHSTLPDDAALARKIEVGLKDVLRRVRNISWGLARAEVLPEKLPAALDELTSRLRETSGVSCTFHVDKGIHIKDVLEATHLYHIAQEACTNALKHARATSIEVGLLACEGATVLKVRDDGVGLPKEKPDGLGLRIMRNRAGVIEAPLAIEAVEPHGTLVTCTLKPERPHGPQSK